MVRVRPITVFFMAVKMDIANLSGCMINAK